jgi:hypothetical protein
LSLRGAVFTDGLDVVIEITGGLKTPGYSDEAFQAFRFETLIINTFHIPYLDEAF